MSNNSLKASFCGARVPWYGLYGYETGGYIRDSWYHLFKNEAASWVKGKERSCSCWKFGKSYHKPVRHLTNEYVLATRTTPLPLARYIFVAALKAGGLLIMSRPRAGQTEVRGQQRFLKLDPVLSALALSRKEVSILT